MSSIVSPFCEHYSKIPATCAAISARDSRRAEQIVERHFGLYDAGMLVALQTVGRHVCEMHGLSCSRGLLEQFLSRTDTAVFGVLDFILRRGELHFAEVYNPVFPADLSEIWSIWYVKNHDNDQILHFRRDLVIIKTAGTGTAKPL